jgi:hypothetical protein
MVDRVNYILSEDSILPVRNFFVSDPFNSEPVVLSNRSGYLPLNTFKTVYVAKQRECNSAFQIPCDTILPKNLCYAKYKTIITQPEGDDIEDD